MTITVRDAKADDPDDQQWLQAAYDADWEGPTMALDGRLHQLFGLPTLVAEDRGELCGYLVYAERPEVTELYAMAAHPRGLGTGRMLLRAFLARADRPVRLVTTNDNVAALAFYQQHGFRITGVRVGAVDRSRMVKPEIPEVGERGIPLHDELVLEWRPRS